MHTEVSPVNWKGQPWNPHTLLVMKSSKKIKIVFEVSGFLPG